MADRPLLQCQTDSQEVTVAELLNSFEPTHENRCLSVTVEQIRRVFDDN